MWVVALAACVQPPEPATDPIAEVELPGCAGQHDDPIDEYAYVVDTMGRVMRQVNPRSCTVGATIGLGSHPIAAAVTGSGNWIYVGDDEDLTLTAISQPRDEVDAVIQLPFPPTELLFEPAHTVLWATDPVSGAAALIESEHHTLVDELTLPAGFTVLASTDAAPQTMVVGHPDGFLQIIELALRTELARIELGGPPLAVGYASNIERSYVCIGGDQPELAVIPATGPSAWIVTRRIELDAPCTGIRFNGYPVGVAIQAERDTALIVDPITDTIVIKFNQEAGLVTSPADGGVPLFARFFLGGISDLRGFPLRSVGPRLPLKTTLDENAELIVNGANVGGNLSYFQNLELEVPIIQAVGLRGVIFTDLGNAWNLEQVYCQAAPGSGFEVTDPCFEADDLFKVRTSWGFGLRWFSPLGPLRFEWGFPFSRLPYEDPSNFQFTIGNFF